jgi:hypothetical protein
LLDISASVSDGRIYILRSETPEDQSLVDVWTRSGRFEATLVLDMTALSIACGRHGDLYLLHGDITERVANVSNYTAAGLFEKGAGRSGV